MIIEMIGTISQEIGNLDHPVLLDFLKKYNMSHLLPVDLHCVVHGKVTDVYRVIAR